MIFDKYLSIFLYILELADDDINYLKEAEYESLILCRYLRGKGIRSIEKCGSYRLNIITNSKRELDCLAIIDDES